MFQELSKNAKTNEWKIIEELDIHMLSKQY